MNKDEILEKSRKQGDEREKIIKVKSGSFDLLGTVIVLIFFMIWRFSNGQSLYDLAAIATSGGIFSSFFRYNSTKNIKFLLWGILYATITIFWIFMYIKKF